MYNFPVQFSVQRKKTTESEWMQPLSDESLTTLFCHTSLLSFHLHLLKVFL